MDDTAKLKDDIRHKENITSKYVIWALRLLIVAIAWLFLGVHENQKNIAVIQESIKTLATASDVAVIKVVVEYNKDALDKINEKLEGKK